MVIVLRVAFNLLFCNLSRLLTADSCCSPSRKTRSRFAERFWWGAGLPNWIERADRLPGGSRR
jgi:hypothetical protein